MNQMKSQTTARFSAAMVEKSGRRRAGDGARQAGRRDQSRCVALRAASGRGDPAQRVRHHPVRGQTSAFRPSRRYFGGRKTANWSVTSIVGCGSGRPPRVARRRGPEGAARRSARAGCGAGGRAGGSSRRRRGRARRVEVAELRDRERGRREREADVRVRELRAQPLAPGERDRAVVEGERRQVVHGVPGRVLGTAGSTPAGTRPR